MGTVVQLKNQIDNSYFQLKNLVENRLISVEEKIKSKLISDVDLVQKMTDFHVNTGGKRLRALLTLGSAKMCGYSKGTRDINLAACVELIHSATLMHDDVIDNGTVRRGKRTLNKIWGNHSSVLIGDYLLSRCFEMMVDDGNLEVLKLLSSTSSKIAQGEVLQLQHNREVDMLEETYLKIISAKTAELFAAATKVGAILSEVKTKEKEALEFYGRNLGLTFQIADDTLDYNSDLKLFGKKIGQDFYEGKITLPIILLLQKIENNEKEKIKNIFLKDELKMHKIKKLVIEDELVNSNKMGITTLKLFMYLDKKNILIIKNNSYFKVIYDYDNTDIDIKNYYIIFSNNDGFYINKSITNNELKDIIANSFLLENYDKPLKSISSYKLYEIQKIAQLLKINIFSSSGKNKTKQLLYTEILEKII